MSGTNRNLLKPHFRPVLFRIATGGESIELDTRGSDRAYFFASGVNAKTLTLRVWGRSKAEIPESTETTVPPTTVPVELPDPLTEGDAWFVLGEIVLTVAAADSPDAPDGKAGEFSSPIKSCDVQMCDAIKVIAKGVTGPVTVWGGVAEANYVGPAL